MKLNDWTADCGGDFTLNDPQKRYWACYWPDHTWSATVTLPDGVEIKSGIIQGGSKAHAMDSAEGWIKFQLQDEKGDKPKPHLVEKPVEKTYTYHEWIRMHDKVVKLLQDANIRVNPESLYCAAGRLLESGAIDRNWLEASE